MPDNTLFLSQFQKTTALARPVQQEQNLKMANKKIPFFDHLKKVFTKHDSFQSNFVIKKILKKRTRNAISLPFWPVLAGIDRYNSEPSAATRANVRLLEFG